MTNNNKENATPQTESATTNHETEYIDKILQEYIDHELLITKGIEILNTPQFEKLVITLSNMEWEVDIRALDRNVLHIYKEPHRYVLYLFYHGKEDNMWVANEDANEDGERLWLSEFTDATSPVYSATKYFKTLDTSETQFYPPIVVLMPPVYLMDATDMLDDWGSTLVLSCDRLCKLIKKNEWLHFMHTNPKELEKYRNPQKVYKIPKNSNFQDIIRERDNKLKWLKTVSDEEIYSNFAPAVDAEAAKEEEMRRACIEVENIMIYINRDGENNPDHTHLALSRVRTLSSGTMSIKVDIKPNESLRPNTYSFELRKENDELICSDTRVIESDSPFIKKLTLPSIPSGDYWLYIKHDDKQIFDRKITFIELEQEYTKYMAIEAVGLHRIDPGDPTDDLTEMVAKGSHSHFDHKGLEGVYGVVQLKNTSDSHLKFQSSITIQNEQGERIFEKERTGTLYPNEYIKFVSKIVTEKVRIPGNYIVKVYIYEELAVEYDFTVGEQDIQAIYNIKHILKLPPNKDGVDKIDMTPTQELDSMIGLSTLKKQLHKHIAKIELDRLRKQQGFPSKPQQLHMAFLGNPGTGKTTVAKLLGKIYREIGVLSNGHLVTRDRPSLSTQNWNGEGELVNKALEESEGGVLFIDEAYDIVTEHPTDPGKLIVSALLQSMSDEHNRDFMVIFAGYTLPMERFLNKNPGLRSRLTPIYFDDYNVPELMQIADLWLDKNCYTLTPDARRYFESIVSTAYASRDDNFGNARYVINLLENEVQPAMAERVMSAESSYTSNSLLTTIEACDIPNYNAERGGADDALARLNNMIGLGELKMQLRSHLSYIRFVQARRDNKIDTPIPPLHMIFTGNPGTGKTSVAEYLGDIYRSMGILSTGNVIKVSRTDMTEPYIGGTEKRMRDILNAARGNILFIDEAYTLFSKNERDVGKIAMETLLDTLGKENPSMIIILAGYPKEMEQLLNINPGLKGRFPYTFNFEDYDEEELFEIAQGVVKRNSLTLTDGAADALKAIIRKECKTKDSNFSNARFVTRLITTQVLPNMAIRLEGEREREKLQRIHQRDIPIEHKEIRMINENLFDEDAIESALERLDAMVGLTKVKVAIHQFVEFARTLFRKEPTQIERHHLKWSFVGNTGTGKSSVAEILSEILKAMHLLSKGHTVEVKAEELYGVPTHKADELLQQRMRESLQGLLFVDGDAPQFRASNSSFNPEYLRMCLAVNTAEIHGRFAVVIAEQDSPSVGLAKSLNKIGISNFDHTLIFDDYTAEELMAILSSQLSIYELQLNDEASTIMYSYIKRMRSDNNTINARTTSELATAITNLALTSNIEYGVIGAEVVMPFASLSAPHTKIGF